MILESLFGGGVLGFVGSIASNVMDYFKRRQEMKHLVTLKELDIELMEREWAYRERAAIRETEAELERSADELMAASYRHDRAAYALGLAADSRWAAVCLVCVDMVRGLVRPCLTVLLIVMVWDTRNEVMDVVERAGPALTMSFDRAVAVYDKLVDLTVFLATTALSWWFGTRSKHQRPTV